MEAPTPLFVFPLLRSSLGQLGLLLGLQIGRNPVWAGQWTAGTGEQQGGLWQQWDTASVHRPRC